MSTYIYTRTKLSDSSPAPNSSDKFIKLYLILNSISFLLVTIMLGIIFSEIYSEKDKFEYVYYMSKIMTIKQIIIENHYSEILEGFNSDGEPITFPMPYKRLLKLVKNKTGCVNDYKPCGILDTYGNVLCIEEALACPINKLKADHVDKASYYSDYGSASLSNMGTNYKLYYSNDFIDRNIATVIIKTKDEPKYITHRNFILDSEAFSEVFGDKDFLDKIGDIFDLKGEENRQTEKSEEVDDTANIIFKQVSDIGDDLDTIMWGAKLLYSVISYEYDKNVKKFDEYVKEQIEIMDEKNIDEFFEYIGGDFYAKNYIGFKSVEDINNFLKFDFNIYKKKFPNFHAAIGAIIGLSFLCLFICISIIPLFIYKSCDSDDQTTFFIYEISENIIFYGFALGYIIYALYVYLNVNKSKSLDELKSIKSDEYINRMINDLISECQKSFLIILTFFMNGFAIVINIISLIFFRKATSSNKN